MERLHEEAETKLKRFLDKHEPVQAFNAFQTNLKGLTEVTRNYFDKFVQQLETGFDSLEETFIGERGDELRPRRAFACGHSGCTVFCFVFSLPRGKRKERGRGGGGGGRALLPASLMHFWLMRSTAETAHLFTLSGSRDPLPTWCLQSCRQQSGCCRGFGLWCWCWIP